MFARTERLLLRPSWPEDAQELHAAIADEGIVRNLARAPWPYTADDAVHFTAQAHDERHPAFLLMLRTKGAPRLVGGCGIGDLDGEAELGFWIARPYWGLGSRQRQVAPSSTSRRQLATISSLPATSPTIPPRAMCCVSLASKARARSPSARARAAAKLLPAPCMKGHWPAPVQNNAPCYTHRHSACASKWSACRLHNGPSHSLMTSTGN